MVIKYLKFLKLMVIMIFSVIVVMIILKANIRFAHGLMTEIVK